MYKEAGNDPIKLNLTKKAEFESQEQSDTAESFVATEPGTREPSMTNRREMAQLATFSSKSHLRIENKQANNGNCAGFFFFFFLALCFLFRPESNIVRPVSPASL